MDDTRILQSLFDELESFDAQPQTLTGDRKSIFEFLTNSLTHSNVVNEDLSLETHPMIPFGSGRMQQEQDIVFNFPINSLSNPNSYAPYLHAQTSMNEFGPQGSNSYNFERNCSPTDFQTVIKSSPVSSPTNSPLSHSINLSLVMTAYHKPRGNLGVWQAIGRGDRIRVTKGNGKMLKLTLQSPAGIIDTTNRRFDMHIIEGDLQREKHRGNSEVDSPIHQHESDQIKKKRVHGDGFQYEIVQYTNELIEIRLKIRCLCRSGLRFYALVGLQDGSIGTASTIPFISHDDGKKIVEKSKNSSGRGDGSQCGKETNSPDFGSEKKRKLESFSAPPTFDSDDEDDQQFRYVADGALDVKGIVRAHEFRQFSDMRLKTNIQDLVDAISLVSQLKGKRFEWRDNALPNLQGGKKVIGLIAQEVQRVVPEAVHVDENGILSVSYTDLIPILIEAFKQLLMQHQEHRDYFIKELQGLRSHIKEDRGQIMKEMQTFKNLFDLVTQSRFEKRSLFLIALIVLQLVMLIMFIMSLVYPWYIYGGQKPLPVVVESLYDIFITNSFSKAKPFAGNCSHLNGMYKATAAFLIMSFILSFIIFVSACIIVIAQNARCHRGFSNFVRSITIERIFLLIVFFSAIFCQFTWGIVLSHSSNLASDFGTKLTTNGCQDAYYFTTKMPQGPGGDPKHPGGMTEISTTTLFEVYKNGPMQHLFGYYHQGSVSMDFRFSVGWFLCLSSSFLSIVCVILAYFYYRYSPARLQKNYDLERNNLKDLSESDYELEDPLKDNRNSKDVSEALLRNMR